jgi:hypothetical protein
MMTPVARDGLLRQSRHVLATADADELVLLDLRSGRYFTLNDVGSRIWTLLASGTTLRSIIEAIRSEYDVTISGGEATIERDVEQLLASFLAARLITADTTYAPAKHAPSPWTCAALLFAVRVGLKHGGIDKVCRVLGSRLVGTEGEVHDRLLIDACTRSVALAAAFFPGRALCLERSLTLWYVLRSRGVPVELCLGVQKFPFAAHAWVAHRGDPLNDVPEHVAHFQPLMAVTP